MPAEQKPFKFEITFVFKDNHQKDPATVHKSVHVTIIEKPSSNFDINSLAKNTTQEKKQKDKDPPKMTISKIDAKLRIKIEFDQPIYFNFSNKTSEDSNRRALSLKYDLSELANLTSYNKGRDIFELYYKPSDKSSEMQEYKQKSVEPSWSIELIDVFSFYIVVRFSNLDYISQFERNVDLDSLLVKFKKPELFTND